MKPSVPSGTRDFSPSEMVKRNFIFKTIRETFERYGYQPIETPAMENLSTLEGKYGEEGDKLIYKIRSNKNLLEHYPELKNLEKLREIYPYDWIPMASDKALRYDLTVPFARYVVQHQNEITFPFKRYQIQPVWRADRPQKGRYREFYQCDADVIGSNSLLNEVELIQMIDEVFSTLKIPITIKINNRKILNGLAEIFGVEDKFMDLIIAIDKYEKIKDGVFEELKTKGFHNETIEKIKDFLEKTSAREFGKERLAAVKNYFLNSKIGMEGFIEIEQISKFLNESGKINLDGIHHDLALARGLNYYTGTIIEVKANDVQIGSICGGGRYDDLTGIFGLPNVSGVGISFGIDRIYDVMNELNLFDKIGLSETITKVMFAHFGEAERNFCITIASKLRKENINTEIYPDLVKIKKQFDYANKKQIPFIIVVGEEEIKSGKLTLKNMTSGEQEKLLFEEIILKLK